MFNPEPDGVGPLRTIQFHGTVFSGLGRGAYYVGHPGFRTRFEDLLGYTPFPGTLNLRITGPMEVGERRSLRLLRGDSIEKFRYDGQEFSSVKCFLGILAGQEVALAIPEITEYDDSVLELVAPLRLRDRLGLVDGQQVAVAIEPGLVSRIDRNGDARPISQG